MTDGLVTIFFQIVVYEPLRGVMGVRAVISCRYSSGLDQRLGTIVIDTDKSNVGFKQNFV